MTARNYSSTTPVSVLTASLGSAATSMTLSSSAASFPAPPFTMILAPDTVNEEIVDVTAVSGSVFTITRGVDGTTARSHNSGTSAIHGVSGRDFAEANNHVNATGNPHGTTAADVGAVPTSALTSGTPSALGASASSGSSSDVARLDHVHQRPTASDVGAVPASLVNAKGDLVTATADDMPARLGVGANGLRLVADSAEATGLKWAPDPVVLAVAVSDEATDLAAGAAKITFRMPFAMTVTAVRASLTTASSSGTPTFDINEGGTSILGTKLSIDANEKTSTTAATAATITDSALADDAEITVDIDAAGTGAKGAKVYIIGTRA